MMASNQAVVEVEVVDVTHEIQKLRQEVQSQAEWIRQQGMTIESLTNELVGKNKFEVLLDKCEQWGRDRMIIQNGRLDTQALKLCEEATETLIAARKFHKMMGSITEKTLANGGEVPEADKQETTAYLAELADGIGDTIVVLVQLCAMSGLDMYKCLEGAYETIKDRRGYLSEEGVFVKET
jgi:NTP pyrophosphatase (non-canonical NTP hydrolase)